MGNRKIVALINKSKQEVQDKLSKLRRDKQVLISGNDTIFYLMNDIEDGALIAYIREVGKIKVELTSDNLGGDTAIILEEKSSNIEIFSKYVFTVWKAIVWAFHIVSYITLMYNGINKNILDVPTICVWVASMILIIANALMSDTQSKNKKIKDVANTLEVILNE